MIAERPIAAIEQVEGLQGALDEAPTTFALPGNRIAVIGDSTARGVYTGDSEAGITDGVLITVQANANSWLTWAQSLSGGAVNRCRNASVIGNTIAMMDARVVADVCTFTPKPSACIIYSGYNDAIGNVTPSAYMASLASIVGKLRAYGIVPILATPLPTANSGAEFASRLILYALNVRKFAGDEGLMLLDFMEWTTDPADGGLIAAVKTGGDGVHPGAAGQKWLGQKVVDALSPYLAPAARSLQVSPLDTLNLAPNGLFAGTPTSGVAPDVFRATASDPSVTPSVVTDALVPGNMQRFEHSGSTAVSEYYQSIEASYGWADGDWLEFSGVVTASGISASVYLSFGAPPYNQRPISLTQDVDRAYFCARIKVPTMSRTYFWLGMRSGPGTGTADFGQLTIRNLTALGLV